MIDTPEARLQAALAAHPNATYVRVECIDLRAYLEVAFGLRETIEALVSQFGYWSDSAGGLHTGGLSALEDAFDALGWEDPHPQPDMRCDEPGCMKQQSVGAPTPTGYRSMCTDHGLPFLADLR
jgi:hypothetical protein